MKALLRLFCLLLGCAAAPGALAFDLATMTQAERTALHNEIRAYLLENPEVIREALEVLQQRQDAQQAERDKALVQAHAQAIFHDGFSYVGGNPEGDITLVEFIDYRCGYCRRAHEDVQQLLESDGNIRFIVKEFPILGEASLTSARFAIATKQIAGDAAYKAAHEALIRLTESPSSAGLGRLAQALGLDGEAILAHMQSDAVETVIRDTQALARALQIRGTPSFVLEDEMLRGYLPLAAMQERVAAKRTQGKANP